MTAQSRQVAAPREAATASEPFGGLPLFVDLAVDVRRELVAASWARRYSRGQVLCSEGDPADHLLVLEQGRVKASRSSADGREVVLAVLVAPAAFGKLALIDGRPRSATLTAQVDVAIRYLPRPAFLDLIMRDPTAALRVMHALAGMVRARNDRILELVALDVPGRIARWLLRQAAEAEDSDAERPVVAVCGSQAEIAAALGTTRSTFNRALKRFEALGLIALNSDEILLLDPAALAGYADL